jgi:hypothetical protein
VTFILSKPAHREQMWPSLHTFGTQHAQFSIEHAQNSADFTHSVPQAALASGVAQLHADFASGQLPMDGAAIAGCDDRDCGLRGVRELPPRFHSAQDSCQRVKEDLSEDMSLSRLLACAGNMQKFENR